MRASMKAILLSAALLVGAIGEAEAGFSSNTTINMGLAALSAVTSSLGGSVLLLGACTTNTTAVPGAAIGMTVVATPTTNPGAGAIWYAYVSAPEVVTTKVCALVALTPVSTVYNLRIF